MKAGRQTIEISRSIDDVFDFLTDFSKIEESFDHISEVAPIENDHHEATAFRQTRSLHGRRWNETAHVLARHRNTRYTLNISIFGVDATYAYHLKRIDATKTRIQLTRDIYAKGWVKVFYPLVLHVLVKPEHDGPHLEVLKRAIEGAADAG